ncbi:hypothetical protein NESM_000214300 [Novymonas esmeraldas]|uniref:Uncharacterized protein n=1 Tax=Novymonas esmeraldas TaxID=1808958 RepID=A0AAW0F4L8_9TRYP
MHQFVVQKKNRVGEEVWTTRILTVDTENHVLHLSKRREAGLLSHHSMVTIKKVAVWPSYSWLFHSSAFFLGDSRLTLCITGSTVTHGESSAVTRLLRLRTRKMTAPERTALEASRQHLTGDEASSESDVVVEDAEVYRSDGWMLRCMTEDDMQALLSALSIAVIDTTRMKGEFRKSA